MYKSYRKMLLTMIVLCISLLFLLPLVITITNSFMSEEEISLNYEVVTSGEVLGETDTSNGAFANIKLIPDEVVFSQYYQVLIKKIEFLFFFWNSVKIVIPIVGGQLAVASLAANAFAKLRFKYRDPLFFIYIVTMLMPYQVTLVPNYLIVDRLGWIGKFPSIIIPGIFSTFGVFLLRQFMIYIPEEYPEAARVDGASQWGIFCRIIMPMSKAGLASLTMLLFIDSWNMVEQPVVFLKEFKDFPLSVVLSKMNESEVGVAFAASTLYMAPMLLLFLYGENYLVEGLQLSGLKG